MIKTKINFNAEIDTEKLAKNLNEGIKNIQEVMKKLEIPEEVTEKEIKPFGNASHIILPKEYANKKAIVIIKK